MAHGHRKNIEFDDLREKILRLTVLLRTLGENVEVIRGFVWLRITVAVHVVVHGVVQGVMHVVAHAAVNMAVRVVVHVRGRVVVHVVV